MLPANEDSAAFANCGSKARVITTTMSIRKRPGARSIRSVFATAITINMPETRIIRVALCPAANPFTRSILITLMKRLWIMSGLNTLIVDERDGRVTCRGC